MGRDAAGVERMTLGDVTAGGVVAPVKGGAGVNGARGAGPRGRAGFSLVEVIVALLVLTIGLLGLAAGTGWMIRTVHFGQVETARSTALQSAVESVRAMPYGSVVDGSEAFGDHTVAWEVTATGQQSRVVRFIVTGPGRQASAGGGMPEVTPNAVDTFTYRLMRRD